MTETLTDVVCANREKVAEAFASKAALEKVSRRIQQMGTFETKMSWFGRQDQLSGIMQAVLEQEARIAGFKSEVVKGQELHLASLTRDTERLSNSLEKIRSEIKCGHKLVQTSWCTVLYRTVNGVLLVKCIDGAHACLLLFRCRSPLSRSFI